MADLEDRLGCPLTGHAQELVLCASLKGPRHVNLAGPSMNENVGIGAAGRRSWVEGEDPSALVGEGGCVALHRAVNERVVVGTCAVDIAQ